MVAKQYRHSLSKILSLCILSFTFVNAVLAENSSKYFKSDDSTVFKNIDKKSSNINDQNPIITVDRFDSTKLIDLEEYKILKSDLEKIIAHDQKSNNNRYTVDRLENLAEKLSFYYKEKGLILDV